jgi:hypothetical protein
MVDDAHEAVEYDGVPGPTWLAAEALANDQADDLAEWDPPSEDNDPTALAALIPRG